MLDEIFQILIRSGSVLWELLPYILGGILLSEILKYTPWTSFVRRAVSRSPIVSIFIASIIGVISPLCTYGTIPLIIHLYRDKVPLAPLLTFLSASSLMNPQLFLITWGGLGIELALIRLAGVLIFTLLLGFAISFYKDKLFSKNKSIANKKIEEKPICKKDVKKFSIKSFLKDYYSTLEFIGYYIILGILLSVILDSLVPLSMIFELTRGNEWINIIAASLLGIPLYACGGAAIPVVQVLLENGISTGAVIGFLIVGPGTRILPILALRSFLSKRSLAWYVAILLLYSIILGLIINIFVGV